LWRHQNHALDVSQVVDFAEELTQNPLVDVGAEQPAADFRRDGVDRVEEQQTRRRAPGLLEHLAQRFLGFTQPFRVELWAVDGDERDLLLAGERPRDGGRPGPDGPTSRMPRGGARPTCS